MIERLAVRSFGLRLEEASAESKASVTGSVFAGVRRRRDFLVRRRLFFVCWTRARGERLEWEVREGAAIHHCGTGRSGRPARERVGIWLWIGIVEGEGELGRMVVGRT